MAVIIDKHPKLNEKQKQRLEKLARQHEQAASVDYRQQLKQKQAILRAKKRASDLQAALNDTRIQPEPFILHPRRKAKLNAELGFFRLVSSHFELQHKIPVDLSLWRQINAIKPKRTWRDDLVLLSNWNIVKIETDKAGYGLPHELVSDATRRAMKRMVVTITTAAEST